MASQAGHNCVGCGVQMPIEDGHDRCVLCLGQNHASLARDNPSSCMNCFILPARSLEARYCVFSKHKQPAQPTVSQQAKRLKGAEFGVGSVKPLTVPPLRSFLRAESWVEEQEEAEEVDVIGASSSDSDLPPGQGEAGPELEEGERVRELRQFRGLIERAAQALGVDSTVNQAPAPSRFDDGCDTQPAPFLVPLLSDVEELMQA